MTKATIAKRFDELKDQRPFSARWLSQSMGVNRFSINKILGGDVVSERDKLLFRALLEKISVSESQFFGGKIPAEFATQSRIESGNAASSGQPKKPLIPLYGDIPAGNPTWTEGAHVQEYVDSPPGSTAQDLFALRVSGQSMAPQFMPGDLVYLRKLDIRMGIKDPKNPVPALTFERLNGRTVAALIDNEATLKQLKVVRLKNDYELRLIPFNPEFEPIVIGPHNHAHFQGVVVKLIRDLA